MERKTTMNCLRVAMATAIFGAGYLSGSLTPHTARAQMGDLGGELMQKAGSSGGMVGTVAQLGSTIKEMESHLSGLQKNLDVLKKIKGTLGGR